MCTIAHSCATLRLQPHLCEVMAVHITQHSQPVAGSLAWKRVSPSVRSDDDVKLQLVDRVCPGVDLGSPTNPCKISGARIETDVLGASRPRAWQAALGRRVLALS